MNKFPLAILFALVLGLFSFVSCSDSDDDSIEEHQMTTENSAFIFHKSGMSGMDYDSIRVGDFIIDETFDCFEIIYPIIIIDDNTDQQINTDQELAEYIVSWFELNADSIEVPSFQYPIEILLEDSMSVTLNNEEELCYIIHDCYIDSEDEYDDNDYDDNDYDDDEYDEDDDYEYEDENDQDDYIADCYDFVFPIEITVSDTVTYMITNSQDLDSILITDDDDYEVGFPFDIIMLSDSTIINITDEDSLEEIEDYCEDQYD